MNTALCITLGLCLFIWKKKRQTLLFVCWLVHFYCIIESNKGTDMRTARWPFFYLKVKGWTRGNGVDLDSIVTPPRHLYTYNNKKKRKGNLINEFFVFYLRFDIWNPIASQHGHGRKSIDCCIGGSSLVNTIRCLFEMRNVKKKTSLNKIK